MTVLIAVFMTVFAAAAIFFAAYALMLRKDIRSLTCILETISKTDTNMRLTTETFDKDICRLCDIMNEALDRQKEISAETEKSNREFRQAITNISHDLRTPLTSSIGYIQLCVSGKTVENKKREYLSTVEARLKSLSRLMDELFEYTQITEGRVDINPEKVNVFNVLRDTLSEYYNDFTGKEFEVTAHIPASPFYLFCDPVMLKRIIQNILQNTLIHGKKEFALNASEGIVIFKNKTDNLELIEPEKLFDRFYTADLSRTEGGTGLGLAIAKELIHSISGKIRAYAEDGFLCIEIKFEKDAPQKGVP